MRLTIPLSGRPVDVALVGPCVMSFCFSGYVVSLKQIALLPWPRRRR